MILPVARLASGVAAIATTASAARSSTIIAAAAAPPLFGILGTLAVQSRTMAVTVAPAATVTALATTTTDAVSLAFVRSLRGGAIASATAGAALLDLKREIFFAEGMATYATVSALMMNAALMLCTSTKFSKDQNKVVVNTFRVTSVLCILTGAFTAILFQLVTLYSKSALSMVHNDEGYLAFKAATEAFRVWGFRCFLSEVMTLVITFLVKLYNVLWDDARIRTRSSSSSTINSNSTISSSSGCDDVSNSSSSSKPKPKPKLLALISTSTSTLTPAGNLVIGGSIAFAVVGSLMIRSILRLAAVHIYNTT